MLLVLDVGNTNTVMGIFEGKKLIDHWRLTSRKQTADEVGFMILGLLSASGITKDMIRASVYASVVPSLDEMFMEGIKNYIGVPCLKVSPDLDTGVKIRMKTLPGLGLTGF